MPRPTVIKLFRNPQALSSVLAALRTLQPRALRFLNSLVTLVLAFNYYLHNQVWCSKPDRTHVQQGHGTTRFSSHACKPACAHKIGDVTPAVQSFRVHTRCVHNAHVHVRNSHTKFRLCMHANCKPKTVE